MIKHLEHELNLFSERHIKYEGIYLEILDNKLKRVDIDGQEHFGITSEFNLIKNKMLGCRASMFLDSKTPDYD